MSDGGKVPASGSSNQKTWIILAVVAGALLASCACCIPVGIGLLLPAVQKVREAAERTVRKTELSQVGVAIHSFHDSKKQMPANVDDLAPFLDAKVAERIRKGEIMVIWNAVPLKDENRGLNNVTIAWDTQPVVLNQRLVLFMDASVQTITEDQFRTMPKAEVSKEKK